MRLSGRIAVVTGAGSGIGRAIAQLFAEEGATVAALDLRAAAAKETVGALRGAEHRPFTVDVSDGAAVVETFRAIDGAYGRADVLVNNAGVDRTPGDGFEERMKTGQQLVHMTDQSFARLMEVNVNGVFFCTREAVKLMLREGGGGAIVNLSSMVALSGMGAHHYVASKAAILGLTRSCARELGPHGIRVNAVCPGVIDTPMTANVPEAALEGLVAATPLRRRGRPEDIARAALYLAGEESSFVTGQWLSPNGGLVMC